MTICRCSDLEDAEEDEDNESVAEEGLTDDDETRLAEQVSLTSCIIRLLSPYFDRLFCVQHSSRKDPVILTVFCFVGSLIRA